MSCVLIVTYSFIINDLVCGEVNPSRGLYQGNFLSLYLFIMGADAFSGLVQKVTDERVIMKPKLAGISHQFLISSLKMIAYSLL